MAEQVEARSLASLNYLAFNPPQYPHNPAEQRQEPLTLYISRVPGTRDIILSTMKPQMKNVTGADVANSLYYVHLNTPEEEKPQAQEPNSRSSMDSISSAHQIPRKPVGGSPPVKQPGLATDVVDHAAEPRKILFPPTPTEAENRGLSVNQQSNAIPRKPLGPRPMGLATPENEALPPPPPPPKDAHDYPPNLPPRPDEIDQLPPTHPLYSRDPQATMAVPRLMGSRSPSPSKRRPFTPFSLSLIRRDPSTGDQWNIGRVSSFQSANPELTADDRHHKEPSPAISIHLDNSGYAKFRGMPTLQDLGSALAAARGSLDLPSEASRGPLQPGSMRQRAESSAAYAPPRPPFASEGTRSRANSSPITGGFNREVMMTYVPSITAALRQHFRRRESREEEDSPLSPANIQRRDRSSSNASAGGTGFPPGSGMEPDPMSGGEGSEKPVYTHPGPGLKPHGYMFVSPWDGKCEFRTGNGGRSLKCRHLLPNSGGGMFNPLVGSEEGGSDRGPRSPMSGSSSGASIVSELRFNLPSTELFKSNNSAPEGSVRTMDHLQGQFNRVLKLGHEWEDSDEEPGAADMSISAMMGLGKEKAGGGNRGKRAKMGKLIVGEEGLKMLDLVVAANVGVWWVAWERTFE